MGVNKYEDLIAWQLAVELGDEVRELMMGSAEARTDLRYRSQTLEASRGVASHIVEGFLRCSPREFRHFLDYAISSVGETGQRLRDGIKAGYFTADRCAKALTLVKRCGKCCLELKRSQRL